LEHLEWVIALAEEIEFQKTVCSEENFAKWFSEMINAGDKFLSFNDQQKVDIFIWLLGKIGR
jgi:hypothetical protein